MLNKFQTMGGFLGAFVIGFGGLVGGALGCGGSSPATTSTVGGGNTGGGGGTGGTGGGGDGGGGGSLATLDVLVNDMPYEGLVLPVPALANARVLFDPPGGGARQEAMSDATGHVHFTGIDWSKGSGRLTAIGADTKALYSLLDINPDTMAKNATLGPPPSSFAGGKADAYLFLFERHWAPKLVSLSGNLQNAKPQGSVIVSPTVPGSVGFEVESKYDILVLADTPFSLITDERVYLQGPGKGFEVSSSTWSRFDVAALSAAGTKDLDLTAGTPITPIAMSGTIVPPGGASGPFAEAIQAHVYVRCIGSAAICGVTRKTQPTADGAAWNYDLEYVPLDGFTPIRLGVIAFNNDRVSITVRDGAPVADESFAEFVVPPVITKHGPGLLDPIVLEPLSDALARINALDPATGLLAWQIDSLDRSVTQINLPELPADVAAKLPATLRAVMLGLGIAGYDPIQASFRQYSYGKSFNLQK